MKSKLPYQGGEVMAGLEAFAREQRLAAARFTAVGAFRSVEVPTLAGDVALKDGDPAVHAHVVVGRSDGTAHGGHLMEARARPTLEVMLVESPAHLRKVVDARTGLALIQL